MRITPSFHALSLVAGLAPSAHADINQDGTVNGADLGLILSASGGCL